MPRPPILVLTTVGVQVVIGPVGLYAPYVCSPIFPKAQVTTSKIEQKFRTQFFRTVFHAPLVVWLVLFRAKAPETSF